MPSHQLSPNVPTYSAVISACAQAGQWETALQLLRAIYDAQLAPDLIVYNAAIAACEKGERWGMAVTLLDELRQRKHQPSIVTFNSMLSACSRGQQWTQILCFRLLPKPGCKEIGFHQISWTIFMLYDE